MERRHRIRAARNLLAAVLLLAFLWWLQGCPMPTAEMNFRRSERTHLMEESRIVFTCESKGERIRDDPTMLPGMVEQLLSDPTMLVGVTESTVHTSSRTHRFNVWPKNPEGATLVVLPAELEYSPVLIAGLVAVEPPALAERAVLTIRVADKDAAVEGTREGEVFLFRMKDLYGKVPWLGIEVPHYTTDLPPYTLEFFSGDGTLLETVTNP